MRSDFTTQPKYPKNKPKSKGAGQVDKQQPLLPEADQSEAYAPRSQYRSIMHFWAMLKKDYIIYKRNIKRQITEIIVPMLLIFIIVLIHWNVPTDFRDPPEKIDNAAMVFGPLANGQRLGLSNNSREMMVDSMLLQVADQKEFYEFQNITDPAQVLSTSVFVTWRGDNCKATSFNKARERWAIIGDVQNSQIIQELKQDVEDFLYFKEHSKQHVKELNEKMAQLLPDMSHLSVSDSKIAAPIYRPKPLEFRTEEEFSEYLNHPDYELSDERPGVCFGIQISDNIGTSDEEVNGPDIQVRVHMESKPGRTPTADRKPHEKSFSQMCMFSSSIDPKDDFVQGPDSECIPLLIQQGFSYIHNWVANAAMRVLTKNHQSEIVLSMVPFKVDRIEINEFEHALVGIFSYIQIMIYLLPIYGFILRLQEEKIIGLKQHLTILGLSSRAQLLALFISYAAQITLVCCGILFTMWAGDLFPKSLASNPGLFFLYFWIQGIAGFGFVILVALLPENMYPKLAAQWGTLIYFGSTFADFTIQKQQIPEVYKVLMSVIFPTLATARSSRNLVLFEYKKGGPGLTWDSIFVQYDQYRMASYYAIMAFSFFFHLSIGLLFERYGSLPKIVERVLDIAFRRRDIVEASGLTALKKASKGVSADNFEKDQKTYSPKDVLEVRDLVKIFRSNSKVGAEDGDTNNSQTNRGFFCAVDHINMTLHQDEIFSFLGHNGAGKTTTISMLTGMLEASQGSVECFGKTVFDMGSRQDNSAGIQDFRQILGVCPQHDILFDLMTVEEHLDIFCDFKGVKSGKQTKIEKILRDVGLQEHRKQRAGDLSGGNKRKLSVALALVTDSKIVFLDEPTSGMDLTARRRLWNMLKEYRKGRIIILTTHNMDEADLLGDRVGMMKNGRLVCLGSSRFLKDKFKQRYQLKVLLKSSALGDKRAKTKICEFLKKKVTDDVSLFEHTDKELNFDIPLAHRRKLAQFFSEFDLPATLEALKIESYVIKMTSLEDVFLDIGEGIEESEPKTDDFEDEDPIPEESGDQIKSVHQEGDINDQIDTYRKQRPYLDTLLRQTGMLIVRQTQAFRRNLPAFAFDVSLPAILVGLGLLFSMFQFAIISKEVNVAVSTFRLPQRVMVNRATHYREPIDDDEFDEEPILRDPSLFTIDPVDIAENMPGFEEGEIQLEYYDHLQELAELEQLDQAYRVQLAENNVTLAQEYDELLSFNKSAGNRIFRQKLFDTRFWDANMSYPDLDVKKHGNDTAFAYRYGSMFVYEANNDTKKFKVQAHINLTNCYSSLNYPHFIYQGVLRAATGKKNLNFNLTTVPFPSNPRTKEFEHEANGVFLCFVAGIGLAMIPASIISRVVSERESEVKHIQIVSGVKLEAYWFSFLLFDLIKAYSSSFIIVAILLLLGVEGGMAISHVILFFPLAIIPFTYTMSFAYEREITAQSFTIYLNFIFSGVFGMIVFVLRMIKQTAVWGDRFVWFCRFLSPLFNVCDAFLYTSTKSIFKERRDDIIKELKMGPKPWNLPSPLEIEDDFSLQNLGGNISALIFQTIFWWLVFIWLEGRKSTEFSFFASPLPPKKTDEELQMDEDVKREEVRVGKTPDQMVQVHKFRKAYQVPFSNPVMAVERASFGVDKGQCFALLGVNGAGKSTTFKSLTNVVQATDGTVKIMGKSISDEFNDVRHRIGYCPQMHTLFNHVTVLEHLKFFAELKGIPDMLQPKLIDQVVKKFNIQRHINKEAQQLSGGTKRKLQVAIALLGNPCVVLLDEPSAGMDPAARKFMWKVVKGITDHDQKTCVVLTTHQMEEAEELSTKMGIMVQGGQFTCFGSCQHIKDKFGGGYEVEVKFKDFQEVKAYSAKLKMDPTSVQPLQEFITASIKAKLLPSAKQDMLLSYIKRNVCFQEGLSADKIESLVMEFPKFCGFLSSFLSFQKLTAYVLAKSTFPRLDILETYGFAFIKFRVPKGSNSLGYLISTMEEFLQTGSPEALQIEEYTAQETSLEVIFQYFASPHRSEQNKLREQQENAYVQRLQASDCAVQ